MNYGPVKVSRSDSAASDIEVISTNELSASFEQESPVLVSERTDPLCQDEWLKFMDSDGRVVHELKLRRSIFKGTPAIQEDSPGSPGNKYPVKGTNIPGARRLYIKRRRQNDLSQKKQEATNRGDEELRKRRIAMVQQAIEESKDFITPENLEEKIAHALENETNYNFALTSSGQKLFSKSPPGSVNTELHAPGPAAFMNSPPSMQKEWTTSLTDDESQRPKDEGKKDNSWQKWSKRAKSA